MAKRGAIPENRRSMVRFTARMLPGAAGAPFPGFIEPCIPTLQTKVPSGEKWIHELKLDGYRAQAHVQAGEARVLTRRGHDWSREFAPVTAELRKLPVNTAILDGEIVATENGRISFNALIEDLGRKRTDRLSFYLFDILYLDGFDLRACALADRKKILAGLLSGISFSRVFYSEHFEGDGAAVLRQVCEMGMEGIVSKRKDSAYRSGRTETWIKVKCAKEAIFTIIGVIPAPGGIAALYVARDEGNELAYAGKVGTGFTGRVSRELREALDTIAVKDCAVDGLRKPNAAWVKPLLRAKVQYNEIKGDGHLRHASFRGVVEGRG